MISPPSQRRNLLPLAGPPLPHPRLLSPLPPSPRTRLVTDPHLQRRAARPSQARTDWWRLPHSPHEQPRRRGDHPRDAGMARGGSGHPSRSSRLRRPNHRRSKGLPRFSNAPPTRRRRLLLQHPNSLPFVPPPPPFSNSHQLLAVFPLSTLFPSSASITRLHLMLSPHSPPTWHLSPHSITALSSSLAKLIYRARFNAEVEASTPPSDTDASAWKLRVGRIPDCVSYEDYRARATVKFGEVEEVEFEGGEKGWEDAKWGMQLFWTMRSWVGPVVESLVVLDRWAFVVQGLEEGRRVELVNLFEQGTGSLRNLAIVVRCVGGGR